MTRFTFFVLTVLFLFFIYPYNALAEEPIVVFKPGSDMYATGGQNYQMDQETLLINTRIYVPLRFFAIGIGADKRSFIWNEDASKMSAELCNPGETQLYYEKMIGDTLIDLPDAPDQAANNQNAKTALNYLAGVEVKQGEIFSFNNTAGPYGRERCYITGFSFSGDKVIREMGGGVCRTSTLVYNAVLNAGLPVIERHRHSLPVYYVPKNKDAAVGYGVVDFRFKAVLAPLSPANHRPIADPIASRQVIPPQRLPWGIL